jgi:hypothetical protein
MRKNPSAMKKTITSISLLLFSSMLLHSQYVGIGTPNPLGRLQINHNSTNEPGLLLVDSSTSCGGMITFKNLDHSRKMSLRGINFDNWHANQFIDINSDSVFVATFRGNGFVGIGKSDPTARLHVNGMVKLDGSNSMEFGAGIAGKEINAGKIGYNSFGSGALEIVGAGTNATNRAVYFFAEGGTTFTGPVNVQGNIRVNGNSGTAGQVLTSNGVSDPEWADAAYSNNTRFRVTFRTTTSGSDFMDLIETKYNLNTADITIGANSVTVNKTGLYRIHGVIEGNVGYPAAATPAWAPELAVFISTSGALSDRVPIVYLDDPYRRTNSTTTPSYFLSRNYSLDIHIPAGTTIRMEKTLLWTGVPSAGSAYVYLYGNLISE